jgi:hypothetical protein
MQTVTRLTPAASMMWTLIPTVIAGKTEKQRAASEQRRLVSGVLAPAPFQFSCDGRGEGAQLGDAARQAGIDAAIDMRIDAEHDLLARQYDEDAENSVPRC